MNPVENVNSYYPMHGVINSSTGNYDEIDVFSNDEVTNAPKDFAGRYVQTVTLYNNGVVMTQMNTQFTDAEHRKQKVGKVKDVQTKIQGEYMS